MAKRAYTPELHDLVLAAFRKRRGPKFFGAVSEVARETGCTRRTIKQAYEVGWPDRDLPPIKQLLDGENVTRRVMAQQVAETAEARRAAEEMVANAKSDVDKLKADAAALQRKMAVVAQFDGNETAKREIAIVRGLSAILIRGINFSNHTFTPEVIQQLSETIRDDVLAGNLKREDAMSFFHVMGVFLERLAHAGEVCLDLERKRVGDPTSVVHVEVEALPEADRYQRLQETRDLLDFALKRREVRVIEAESTEVAPAETPAAADAP